MLNITNLNIIINNPLEQFEISEFIYFGGPFIGMKFSLTNLGFYLITVIILIIGMNYLASNSSRILPNYWSLVLTTLFDTVLSIINNQIGSKGGVFFPFIYTLFVYILFSNLIGLIPYSFTPTSQFAMGLGLSFTILIGVTILGLNHHGFQFFSLFVPSGTPLILVPTLVLIEFISYLARAISLGVRLCANMIGGHVLLKIFSTFTWKAVLGGPILFIVSFIPLIFITLFTGLEIAIAFIQAYVFVLLTASYINDALNLH